MIAHKLIVTGTPVRIDRDRIVIRRGDVIETYSTRYYRWVEEEVNNHGCEVRSLRPEWAKKNDLLKQVAK